MVSESTLINCVCLGIALLASRWSIGCKAECSACHIGMILRCEEKVLTAVILGSLAGFLEHSLSLATVLD